MKLFDLTGKVAVITGGNGGIGLGMATGLAEAGADIVIAARNHSKSQAARMALMSTGRRCECVEFDARIEASCSAMIAEAKEKFGRIDILVNNAGFNIRDRGRPEEISISDFRALIDTNLTSALVCAQAAYPYLKGAGGGKIINVSSLASFLATPRMTGYAPSKAGLVQLTRVLASAWAQDNIQVNCILPGWIDTEMTRNSSQKRPGFVDGVISKTPAGRWGTPEDFSGIAVYLASGASNFMTGSEIVLDGGFSFNL